MSNTVNSTFKLRKDTLSNWTSANPILLNGEIAVVVCENDTVFKIGDGTNRFNDLDYVSENEINTNVINSKKISIGLNNTTTGTYSQTSGINNTASGNTSQASGYQSKATHDNSWVWNGDTSLTYSTNYYVSKSAGTFCINPVNGLSGFYIGDQNLSDIYYTKVQTDAIYMSRYNAEACINDYNRYRIIEDLKEISLVSPATASIYDIAVKINEFLTMAKIKWTEDLKDVEYLNTATASTYDCAAKLNEIMLILRS